MSKRYKIELDIDIDGEFWAILPAINVNLHNGITIEFEWLCFGFYMRRVGSKIPSLPTHFYCELDGNFAHRKCNKQCNHCKEEYSKFNEEDEQ